jgi:hypothetical protein
MKLIDVDSKATLEDFLFIEVVYIIFFIKVKDSNELSIAAHFFIVICPAF